MHNLYPVWHRHAVLFRMGLCNYDDLLCIVIYIDPMTAILKPCSQRSNAIA